MTGETFTVRELADWVEGTVEGDGEAVLTGVGSVASAEPDQVTFVLDARRLSALPDSRAGAAIVSADAEVDAPMPLVRAASVDMALAALLGRLGENEYLPPPGVHPSAIVADDVALDDGVAIGPGAVVEAGTKLAAGAVICANVSLGPDVIVGAGTILLAGTVVEARCRIGRNCRIGPNAVIGASGFGYFFADGEHKRTPHTGTVEIGDDVDIGSCSCVDRAKFGATRVGDGTKVDNGVQIAHGVQVGRGCLLVAHVAIGGSAVLKDQIIIGGHTAVRDNITLGQGARIGAFTAVTKDVSDESAVLGFPAVESGQFWRNYKNVTQLPKLQEKVRELEKRLQALEPTADH
ncbi:hypothetical protein LCGC14_1226240 [marine sediment metagenome]|uniref:UDP-3-O-[3-hydroxymyristoyl] glucosamine N-acyltransferase non-repeat region domain-containing protein n=1 Tax=marine sediment metagenome TaxID=412755 RepID=A0A0F9LX00_9ZZZZ